MAATHDAYFAASTEPNRLPAARESLREFGHRHAERRIALVTSGGTTVPLEKNTVRFIDNFSTGNRGAASVEQLLKANYAVVFVYRTHSAFPFARQFTPPTLSAEQLLQRAAALSKCPGSQLPVRPIASPEAHPLAHSDPLGPRGEAPPLACQRETVAAL